MSDRCDAAYESNPDHCHQPEGHRGAHQNRWGTTWADETDTRPAEERQ